MKVYDEPAVFPRPLLRTAFPPPLQCLCTWAYSPRIFGTVDQPYVLKLYYGMCPVRGHRTRASVGLAIDWELEQRRHEENARKDGHENSDAKGSQKSNRRPYRKRERTISTGIKKRQRIAAAEEVNPLEGYL